MIKQLVKKAYLLIRNQQVVGSTPILGSIIKSRVSRGFFPLKPFFVIPQNGSKRLKIGPFCIQIAYTLLALITLLCMVTCLTNAVEAEDIVIQGTLTIIDAPQEKVYVYKERERLLCEAGEGISFQEMAQSLANVGISFTGAWCGNDGLVYSGQCGQPFGDIYIFEIFENQVIAAQSVGFGMLPTIAYYINCD